MLGGRKFHIRAYVLAVGALQVYFGRECLALCSGTPYHHLSQKASSSTTSNETKWLAHITNTAYQNLDSGFQEETCILSWRDDTIAPLLPTATDRGSTNHHLLHHNLVSNVIQQMEQFTGELFRAYENEFGVFGPIPGCFEHYGLDFLVDHLKKVYLLEVNPGPDFKQTGTKLSGIIERFMISTIDVVFAGGPEQPCNLSLVYDGTSTSVERQGRSGPVGGRNSIHISLTESS